MTGYANEGTYDPNGLIVGGDVVTRDVTIISSAALLAGSVLGKITASGKYILSATGAGDGSEVARALLIVDTDASGGDVTGSIYEAGEFDQDKLVFGVGHSIATVQEDLRTVNVHLKDPIVA